MTYHANSLFFLFSNPIRTHTTYHIARSNISPHIHSNDTGASTWAQANALDGEVIIANAVIVGIIALTIIAGIMKATVFTAVLMMMACYIDWPWFSRADFGSSPIFGKEQSAIVTVVTVQWWYCLGRTLRSGIHITAKVRQHWKW